jgi:nucleotide-binding universal stress UspA family protein
MIRIPANVERRHRHSTKQQPELDGQPAAQSTMFGFGGPPSPVAATPAVEPHAKNGAPRIVVGVDGSPASVDAVRWAARQSDLTGAAVEAVISWDYPSTTGMEFGSLDIDWADNARATLADAVHVALGSGANTVTMTVTRGHPAEVLVAAARGADLLVVGSRGHLALPGRLLGSVSEHVAARAPCPVVVVRHVPDPIALGQRTHLSGREVLAGTGSR